MRKSCLHCLLFKKPNLELRNAQGKTPLCIAVCRGDLHQVQALAQAGADWFYIDAQGNNLLHCAALNNQMVIAEWLLEREVNGHALNHKKESALSFAQDKNHTVIAALIKQYQSTK